MNGSEIDGGAPALRTAVGHAIGDLRRIAATSSQDAAEILEFQIAFLEDEILLEEAIARIDEGLTAPEAWRATMAEQIAPFEAETDDYFRARASDLRDLEVRVARALSGGGERADALPTGCIVVADDLPPSRFLEIERAIAGIALRRGSAAGHVAMLARARSLPMAVELGRVFVTDTQAVLHEGCLKVGPDAEETAEAMRHHSIATGARERAAAMIDEPAVTRSGRRIEVKINVEDPARVPDALLRSSDGIGLLRTELTFESGDLLHDEEAQYRVYRSLLQRLESKPLTVRTLDIGGDKPFQGLDQPVERNPFLGLRGIRLMLARPAVFRLQWRALLRAATEGPLRVMLPMVTTQTEIDATRRLADACLKELFGEGQSATLPPIGIMIETPAAALTTDTLEADFFSIGSNDLTQYVMAAARDAAGPVADLLDPLHPAVTRALRMVVEAGARRGIEVSLCGEVAADPQALPTLLDLGLDKFSVASARLAAVRQAVREQP